MSPSSFIEHAEPFVEPAGLHQRDGVLDLDLWIGGLQRERTRPGRERLVDLSERRLGRREPAQGIERACVGCDEAGIQRQGVGVPPKPTQRMRAVQQQGRLVRRVHAGLAQVDAQGLRLFDATVFAFPPDSALAAPLVQWQRELRLDVPELSEPPLLEAEPATLSLPNLWELISQRAGSGDDVTRFRAMLHARLSDPPSVLVLALLAVPLALRVERTKSLAVPALQGGVLLLIFWSLRSGARLLAPTDGMAAIAIPWLLVVAFALFGGVRLARVPR